MSNLPDDVTHDDIDDRFGEPEMVRVIGDVVVLAEAEVPEGATREEMREALRENAIDGEVVDVEVVDVC